LFQITEVEVFFGSENNPLDNFSYKTTNVGTTDGMEILITLDLVKKIERNEESI
jgi:hypothetical protein